MKKANVDSKTDLLAIISHETRNELNVMAALCSMAGNNIDDRERVIFYLDRIYDIIERITAIMDKTIDISRMNGTKEIFCEKVFSIDELQEEIYTLIYPLAKEKNIELNVSSEAFDDREVIGDYSALIQILINLATNSIKYTPNGGIIEICFEETESIDPHTAECRFICKDTGIGMSEEFLKHIYEPFTRAEDERVLKNEGSGLGMAIVRKAVDAMGGSINISSTIGAGTTVTAQVKLKKNIRKA